jgi:anthraniloyl-CoA monooxygenase
VARPHLANPAWTLTEAARIGFSELEWPRPYRSAKPQLEREFSRQQAQGLATQEQANKRLGI